MRIFIDGNHKPTDALKIRLNLLNLGYNPQLVRFEERVGYFIPDISIQDTNSLKTILEEQIKQSISIC